jgi:hypothetical protein
MKLLAATGVKKVLTPVRLFRKFDLAHWGIFGMAHRFCVILSRAGPGAVGRARQ